jgi:hypothetical protein
MMIRHAILVFALGVCFSGCTPQDKPQADKKAFFEEGNRYGEPISDQEALPVSQLPGLLAGQDSLQVTLTGTVLESCRNKGCWMKVEVPGHKPMQVTFKDYGFFVPKNMAGETAIMEGIAYVDTLSVADLRHFAQDAGKSEAEIAAITSPEPTLTFVAKGVIIR